VAKCWYQSETSIIGTRRNRRTLFRRRLQAAFRGKVAAADRKRVRVVARFEAKPGSSPCDATDWHDGHSHG
jgi:hypothetical protein